MKASFKKAIDGLTAQYAGEHLSSASKMNVLNDRPIVSRFNSRADKFDVTHSNELLKESINGNAHISDAV